VSLVPHLLWAVVVVLAVYRLAQAAERFAPVVATDAVDVPFVEIPDDLMALVMQYPEPWAQDDMLKVIRERYEALGDWNRVRAAVGVGARSNA
jgi:hypothetical protein